LELQKLILQAQRDAERRTIEKGGWFISDRSGADPIAYALRYVNNAGVGELLASEAWVELRETMRRSVVIVCQAGEAMRSWLMDDGVRLMPKSVEDWVAFHELLCIFLEEQRIEYAVIPAEMGGRGERVEYV